MRRAFVAIVALATFLVVALPAAAAPPDNPLVGSWENEDVDGSHQHMTIGNGQGLPFTYRDDGATFCEDLGFGYVPLRLSGEVLILEEDPLVFAPFGDAYCYPRGPGGRQLVVEDGFIVFFYDPGTDTLYDLSLGSGCWYRSGNPGACATG